MAFRNLGADEQAETGAGNCADGAGAESPLEHVRPRLRRYADAVITDRNACFRRRRAYLDLDGPTIRRVFDRVADQVLKHTLNAPFVVFSDDRAGRRRIPEGVVLRERLHLVDCRFRGTAEIAAPEIELDLVAVQCVEI